MCGHIRRITETPSMKILLDTLGLGDLILPSGDYYPGSLVDGVIFNDGQAIPFFLPLDKK